MSEFFDTPIFIQTYEVYKEIHKLRNSIPKQDRCTIWQRVENTTLEILEGILTTTSSSKIKKLEILENTSHKLNMLKILVRLAKDTKIININKYIYLQEKLDEIGRMLGGWLRSTI